VAQALDALDRGPPGPLTRPRSAIPSASSGTITSVSATEVSVGVATVSAIAAAASAFASYRAVALSNLPFVTADWKRQKVEGKPDRESFTVPLTNQGPGTALNVYCRVCSDHAPPSEWSYPVYALSPGRTERKLLEVATVDDPFVETVFSDIRGAKWSVKRNSASDLSRQICRLRSEWWDFWRQKEEL
jgi:hypothetical protein